MLILRFRSRGRRTRWSGLFSFFLKRGEGESFLLAERGGGVHFGSMPSYRRVAVASTFSPTQSALLREALNFARKFGAELEALHAGERTAEAEARFEECFARLEVSLKLHWLTGGVCGEQLLSCLKLGGFDLVVAGALGREPEMEGRVFNGSFARRLLREAPCDVLLIPYPSESPPEVVFGVLAVEAGGDVSGEVRGLIERLGLLRLMLVVSWNPFTEAIATRLGKEVVDAHEWAERMVGMVGMVGGAGCEVEARVVDSNTGFGVLDFVAASGADLLAVRGRMCGGRLVLPSHLSWVEQVIPTRFLLYGRGWVEDKTGDEV